MPTKQLSTILQKIQSPGEFYSTGTLEVFPPCLEVKQVGRVSLPLHPFQADQLIQAADQAPYGKGYETLVDTEVRRTWQINADQVSLTGKYWQKNLSDILDKVKIGLGVECDVSAELYKLLVYDTGSFFVSHRDTEKTDGMFATLIIVLPSVYSGGELVVRHKNEEIKLNLCSQEAEEISFAAFYADCVHEVLPVTEGCRLTLVYNLIRSDQKIPLPTIPDYQQAQIKVAILLKNWIQQLDSKTNENTLPEKIVYVLEHEYSISELRFDALKNKDAACACVLRTATKQADCELYLALVSIEERGSAEHTGGGYYNHWDRHDVDDEYEIGEVFEHQEMISEWRSSDDSEPGLPALPFSAEEFSPPEAFGAMEANDIEFQEATGNEGASFERMYHCAALVIWPRSHYLNIINQAGLHAAVPVLKDLYKQWENNKIEETKQQAITLASYIIRDWVPEYFDQSKRYSRSQVIPELLKCLLHLKDVTLINQFWVIIAKKGIYQTEDSLLLAKTSKLLPWSDVVAYTANAVSVSAIEGQQACISLLINLCKKQKPSERQLLNNATEKLFAALPGDEKRFPALNHWQIQNMALSSSDIAEVLECFSMVNVDLAEKTLNYMIAWPASYDIDQLLLPAAIQLVKSKVDNELPTIARLQQQVITHLQTRLAEPLVPPADWSRSNNIKCSCEDCRELKRFLISPQQEKWFFKAAEVRRNHIEHIIRMNKLDIDYSTEKKSRPYSMVCTKNQAGYQRLVKQVQSDKKDLSCLLQ